MKDDCLDVRKKSYFRSKAKVKSLPISHVPKTWNEEEAEKLVDEIRMVYDAI